jgi:hypothetical protein
MESDFEGNSCGLTEVQSWNFPWETEEYTATQDGGCQAEIRIQYLSDTSLETYRYGNAFGLPNCLTSQAKLTCFFVRV